jgi:DNA repair protein SbcD/Mre11
VNVLRKIPFDSPPAESPSDSSDRLSEKGSFMKLLHTADWHLNDRLHRHDRTAHLQSRVEKVAEICKAEQVDVLLIAGDLFSDLATPSQVAGSFRHLRKAFSDFFGRGGIAIAVTGNHDQDGRIRPYLELARAGMELAEPPKFRGDYFSPGKAYLVDTGFIGRVRDTKGQFDVQFVLVPFPGSSRLLTGDETAATSGELNRSIQGTLSGWLRNIPQTSGYDERLQSVMMAHLHVSGADVSRGLFRLKEEQDIILQEADLPSGFAYVALGHIHKPQCIRGQKHIRYAGSLDRLDFGEMKDEKSVVIIEVGPTGRIGDPVPIPIKATPMVVLPISDPSIDRAAITDLVPNASEALVRVEIATNIASDAEAVERLAREALPNITWVEKPRTEFTDSPSARLVVHGPNVQATVLGYLQQRLKPDDPQRDDVLALATNFLDGGNTQ